MNTLINICSTGRSGSTLIDLMLGNARNAFSLGEVNAWFYPYRKHHFKIACSCQKNPCPEWEKIKGFKKNRFHSSVFSALDIDILIDSSKELTWVINSNIWNKNNNLNIYNILLYKDPISFIYSYWKRGMETNLAIKTFKNYYQRFIKTEMPFMSVNYNTFIKSPEKSLSRICSLCKIEYFEGKEKFWDKQHHQLFGSQGIRNGIKNRTSQLTVNEEYPNEFKEILPQLRQELIDNKTYDILLNKLEKQSVFNISKYPNEEYHIKKPAWYYYQKIKQVYKKYFPDEWTNNT